MRIRFPTKQSILCALKIIGGSAAVLAVVLNGIYYGGCPPNIFCGSGFRIYAMRFEYWSIGAVVIGSGLLLSALKDILSSLNSLELQERDIEAIATPISDLGDN